MPVILPSEKGQLRSRLVYFVLYASLAMGSLTMVYPFLLMASGSLKSRVDVQDLDLVPRFIHDDALLFRKYVEAKYNERIEEYFTKYSQPLTAPSVATSDKFFSLPS